MKMFRTALAQICLLGTISPAAANDDFEITYHIERTPSRSMSLDQCMDMIEREARAAGYRIVINKHPGQLGVISGGPVKGGSFVSHCIVVDDKTVSVIQGLDYSPRKGAVGAFADRVHQALIATVTK